MRKGIFHQAGIGALCWICLQSMGQPVAASTRPAQPEKYLLWNLERQCGFPATLSRLGLRPLIQLSVSAADTHASPFLPQMTVSELLALERPPLLHKIPLVGTEAEAVLLCKMLLRRGFATGQIAIVATPDINQEDWAPARVLVASEVAELIREGGRRYRLLSVEPELQRVLPSYLEYENDLAGAELNYVIMTSGFIINHPELAPRLAASSIILHGNYTELYLALISSGGAQRSMPLVCR